MGPPGSVDPAPPGTASPSPAAPCGPAPGAPSTAGSVLRPSSTRSRPVLALVLCCSRTFSRSWSPGSRAVSPAPTGKGTAAQGLLPMLTASGSRLLGRLAAPFSFPVCFALAAAALGFLVSGFLRSQGLCRRHPWGPPHLTLRSTACPALTAVSAQMPACLTPGPRGCPASVPVTPGWDREAPCLSPSAACVWVSGPARGPQGCVNRLWTCPCLGNSGQIPSQNPRNAENAKIPWVECSPCNSVPPGLHEEATSPREDQLRSQWGLCVPSRVQDVFVSSLTRRRLSQNCLEIHVCVLFNGLPWWLRW